MPPAQSQLFIPNVDCASLDVGNELYECFADCGRPTRERAAGPENKAILDTVTSHEQRVVAGRQAIRSIWASDVDALDEVKLSESQRGEMGISVEVGPELGERPAWRKRLSPVKAVPAIFGLSPRTRAKRIPIRSMRPRWNFEGKRKEH
jgi:hypothetical protein